VALGAAGLILLGEVSKWTTGAPSVAGSTDTSATNVAQLGKSVFTTYLFPFEVTSALLVIAVVGAVVLARRPPVVSNQPGGTEDVTGEDSSVANQPVEEAYAASLPGDPGDGAVDETRGEGAP